MVSTRLQRSFGPLEQRVMEYVWTHPECTAEMCREGIGGERPLKESTVRTVLKNLEAKGYVTHSVDGRAFVYRAAKTRRNVAVQAAQRLIDQFCAGSVEEFLVGLVDHHVVAPKELRRVAERIAARKGTKP